MKRNLLISCLLVVGLLFSVPAVAQNHVIKVTPLKLLPLPFSKLQLGYEGVVSEKVSLGLDFQLSIPSQVTDVPLQDSLGAELGDLQSARFRGFAVTPQARFYLGKKEAPAGFYLNPFLRFFNYRVSTEILYEDPPEEDSEIEADFTYTGFGAGLSLGWQWVFESGFVIDWNIGAGVTPARLGISGTVNGPLEQDVDQFIRDVNTELDGLPFLSGDISGEGTGVNGQTGFFAMPLIRSNLSIGYAF